MVSFHTVLCYPFTAWLGALYELMVSVPSARYFLLTRLNKVYSFIHTLTELVWTNWVA